MQIKQLHPAKESGEGFGFIRPCERTGDLFFHFSQLSEGLSPADLQPNDDVEFSVIREPTPEAAKRVVAARCAHIHPSM
jgi:cold shock CspA family protein